MEDHRSPGPEILSDPLTGPGSPGPDDDPEIRRAGGVRETGRPEDTPAIRYLPHHPSGDAQALTFPEPVPTVTGDG